MSTVSFPALPVPMPSSGVVDEVELGSVLDTEKSTVAVRLSRYADVEGNIFSLTLESEDGNYITLPPEALRAVTAALAGADTMIRDTQGAAQ